MRRGAGPGMERPSALDPHCEDRGSSDAVGPTRARSPRQGARRRPILSGRGDLLGPTGTGSGNHPHRIRGDRCVGAGQQGRDPCGRCPAQRRHARRASEPPRRPRFLVGRVRLRGIRLCEPCSHLDGLTRRGVLAGLIHRGGLRAQILNAGEIHVGDRISPAAASGTRKPRPPAVEDH